MEKSLHNVMQSFQSLVLFAPSPRNILWFAKSVLLHTRPWEIISTNFMTPRKDSSTFASSNRRTTSARPCQMSPRSPAATICSPWIAVLSGVVSVHRKCCPSDSRMGPWQGWGSSTIQDRSIRWQTDLLIPSSPRPGAVGILWSSVQSLETPARTGKWSP